MKKSICFTGLCLLFFLVGCRKEDQVNLFVDSTDIEFDYDEDEQSVSVSCIGKEDFTWSVADAPSFIQFSKTSGSCAKNSPDKFNILLQRQHIHQDSVSTAFTIYASTGESISVSLFIHAFPGNKIMYNKTLRDVAFDYLHNRLLLLSYSSETYKCAVDLFDLNDQSFTTLPLTTQADYFSVSPQGDYLVTGSGSGNFLMQYIDLNTNSLMNDFYVQGSMNGILAGFNKTVYLFYDYNFDIATLNLVNGQYNTYDFGGYFSFEDVNLHPSGKYVYAADGYELTKFSVSGSQPAIMYSTYYYEKVNGLFWLSKDGNRIFTSLKTILTINPELPGNDVVQEETFPLQQEYIYCLEHNPAFNEFYIVPSGDYYGGSAPGDRIMVFDNDYQLQRTVVAEKFYSKKYFEPGYEITDPLVVAVFSGSGGNKIIAVTKPGSSYSQNVWGIEVIDRKK
ncbi:MAG: hypothetical protein JXA03_11855 [Bacteroidales bacterium]|nr:hypothetical protein [Bacteroidales bacterium]